MIFQARRGLQGVPALDPSWPLAPRRRAASDGIALDLPAPLPLPLQLTFAIITAAIISGAVVGKMK